MITVTKKPNYIAGDIPKSEWNTIRLLCTGLFELNNKDIPQSLDPPNTASKSIKLIEQLAQIFRNNINTQQQANECTNCTIRKSFSTKSSTMDFVKEHITWKTISIKQNNTSVVTEWLHTDGVKNGLQGQGASPVPHSIVIPITDTDARRTPQTLVYSGEELIYDPESKQIRRKDKTPTSLFEPEYIEAGTILNDAAVVHAAPALDEGQSRLFVRMAFTGQNLLQAEVTHQDGRITMVSNLIF